MIKLTAKIVIFVWLFELMLPVLQETGPSEAYATNFLCAQDLNGDGYTDSEGETAQCVSSQKGQLCPIGAVNCTDQISAPICPPGSTLNTTTDKCEANPTITCLSGYAYDSSLDICVQDASCPSNGVLNINTDLCEILLNDGSCPIGYTYSNIYQACIQDISCPSGGVYNTVRDRCEIASTLTCPSGYTFNSGTGKCEQAPTCPSGSTYSTTVDKCVQNATIGCPSGYTYNAGNGKCEQNPSCPSGGSYSTANNRCEASYSNTYQCSYSGAVYGNASTCSNNCYNWAYCNANPYSYSVPASISLSYSGPLFGYPAGANQLHIWGSGSTLYFDSFTNDADGNTISSRSAAVTVSGASFSGSSWAYGGTWSGFFANNGSSLCNWIGECVYVSGVYMSTNIGGVEWYDRQDIATNGSGYLYISPYGNNSTYIYFYTNGTGYTYSCPLGGYSCVGSPPYCTQYYGCNTLYNCPSGYSWNGSTCIANPTCGSGGSLNGTTDKCEITPSFTCPGGFTYDSGTGKCVATATCSSGGVLNTAADLCQMSQINDCPSGYTYDSTNNICQSAVVCNPGTFDGALDKCKVVASSLCPSGYTFNATSGKCEKAPVCPSGATYSAAADKCVIAADHQCPGNTTYSSSSRLCEAIPICSAGVYDPVKDGCNEGANICPLGNYACLPNAQGVNQCSPNACIDTDTTQAEITKVDDSMLQDDGPRDADGNCLGQIYLFTGRGMRCRPSGYSTGFGNCCNKSQGAQKDGIGNAASTFNGIKNTIAGVKTAMDIVNVGSVAAQVGGSDGALAIGESVLTPGAVDLINVDTGLTIQTFPGISGQSLNGINSSMGADAAATQAMQNYAAQIGPQIALAAVTMAIKDPVLSNAVNLVGQALLGAGPVGIGLAVVSLAMSVFTVKCDQQDIETSTLNDSKYCHYVGDYCDKKWPILGCVQKARGYCCFNSKLGRIIHEQGRPQLQVFQPNGAWGSGESPNCRGFTPEEFQMLDFGKMDLSEYFSELQTKAVETIQQNATDKVQQYYQNIR